MGAGEQKLRFPQALVRDPEVRSPPDPRCLSGVGSHPPTEGTCLLTTPELSSFPLLSYISLPHSCFLNHLPSKPPLPVVLVSGSALGTPKQQTSTETLLVQALSPPSIPHTRCPRATSVTPPQGSSLRGVNMSLLPPLLSHLMAWGFFSRTSPPPPPPTPAPTSGTNSSDPIWMK